MRFSSVCVVDESTSYDYPGIYWPAVLGAAVGVLVAAVGYRVAPTAVGVVGMLAGIVTGRGEPGHWL